MHGMHGMRGACMPCMGARRLQHAGNKQHRLAQLVTAGCAAPSLRGRRAVLSLSQRQPPPSVGGGAAAWARVAAFQLLHPHLIDRVFATVCSPASRFLADREARIFPCPLPPPPPFVFLHPAAARLCHESFQAQQNAYCLLARLPALS